MVRLIQEFEEGLPGGGGETMGGLGEGGGP